MKKPGFLMAASVLLIMSLLALAFYYEDLNRHQKIRYDIFSGGHLTARQDVDRFDTEGRVIYRGYRENHAQPGYPVVRQTLRLDKSDGLKVESVSYIVEGLKGAQNRVVFQNLPEGRFNYLFLGPPRFYNQQNGISVDMQSAFIPGDIISYLCLIERYDFWKKGLQDFPVLVIDKQGLLPPFLSEVAVRYSGDKYLTAMGQRMSVEVYFVNTDGRRIATLYLGKHDKRLLALELEYQDETFRVIDHARNPLDRIRQWSTYLLAFFASEEDIALAGLDVSDTMEPPGEFAVPGRSEGQDIFFRSQRIMLSGKAFYPDAEGAVPAVILVPPEGLLSRGQHLFYSSLSRELLANGFAVLMFNSPGQGKSQTSFTSYSDEGKARDILAAVEFLNTSQEGGVEIDSINLLACGSAAYPALMAAGMAPEKISSLALVDMPLKPCSGIPDSDMLAFRDFMSIGGRRDEDLVERLVAAQKRFQGSIMASSDEIAFFMGKKLPVMEYRDYLLREPLEALKRNDVPVLLMYGRDSTNYSGRYVKTVQDIFAKHGKPSRTVILRSLGRYMGDIEQEQERWVFRLNEDLKRSVINWFSDTPGRAIPEPS